MRATVASAGGWAAVLGASAAFLYFVALLSPPTLWLGGGGVSGLPLEALVLAGILPLIGVLKPDMRGRLLHGLAAVLLAIFTLSVADTVLQRTFGRPLDVPLDIHLTGALAEFIGDALGERQQWIWGGGIVLVGMIVYWSSFAAARTLARSRAAVLASCGMGIVLIAASASYALIGTSKHGEGCFGHLPFSCHTSRVVTRQVDSALALWAPSPAFDRAVTGELFAAGNGPLLTRLQATDVLLVFVESYGTTALRDLRYASTITPRLEQIEGELTEAGLFVASGRLQAPTVGGLSWLSHGTLLSGLWLDNQRLYQRLIASDRRTLVHIFGEAGHRTVGIFPQMLRPWPEGGFFGYDQIWTSLNIDYSGPRFGWTTMPDQYTLWFLQRKERQRFATRQPLFAEVALISSHAPWEPVPSILEDWRSIGTGEPFVGMADPAWEGPEGWPGKAPENYVRTVAYSLDAVAGYARRFVDEHTLMIVLGDHQPAPLITGSTDDRSVPVHVIAGDPDLIRPFTEWGFVPSMLPALDAPAKRMDGFRDWFVRAFSEAGPARTMSHRAE